MGPRLALAGKMPPDPPGDRCLVMLRGPHRARRYDLKPGANTIGRGRANDICLELANVSRRHATVWCDEDGTRLCDTESAGGTYVNGDKVEEVALRYGDVIDVGPVRFRFIRESEYHQELYMLATTDPLTGAFVPRYFDENLKKASRTDEGFTMLMVAVTCDDEYGSRAHDAVLVEVAGRLRGCVAERDVVARYGDDGFAMLVRARENVGEDVPAAVAGEPVSFEGRAIPVTISVGVAVRAAGEDAVALRERAEAALAEARRGGGNRVISR